MKTGNMLDSQEVR